MGNKKVDVSISVLMLFISAIVIFILGVIVLLISWS